MANMADIPPNHTIYIQNLNDKVKRKELVKGLYAAFSQFGQILDIMSQTSYKMRGQAFIVFQDISSATNAVRQMQNFPFFDKNMRISYAKSKSDVIAKQDGSYLPRDKRGANANQRIDTDMMEQGDVGMGGDVPMQQQQQQQPVAMEESEPNNILFLTQLPPGVSSEMLEALFKQFPGLLDIRMVPGRSDIAFVEYGEVHEAAEAKNALTNFNITPTHKLIVNFARK